MTPISLDVLVERHPATSLPRYAVLPRAVLREHGIEGKATVRGTLNGSSSTVATSIPGTTSGFS